MKLIATKSMTYNTRRLRAGDEFEATKQHARLLVGIKKAVASSNREPGKVAPIPADLAAKVAKANERDDLGDLREQAKAAGIEIDNRWGVKRLQSEIEAKKNAPASDNLPPEPAVPPEQPADVVKDAAGQS